MPQKLDPIALQNRLGTPFLRKNIIIFIFIVIVIVIFIMIKQAAHVTEEEQQFMELRQSEDTSVAR